VRIYCNFMRIFMVPVNTDYQQLQASYLFSEIAKRVKAFQSEHPQAAVIRLGIGDVTLPLPLAVRNALHKATDEMGEKETFRGYGPEQGYDFLRTAIKEGDYSSLPVDSDEIFVSDGSKCDVGNFQEIFSRKATIAISNPVYPVYLDSNVMAGRAGSFVNSTYDKVEYLNCTQENSFTPQPLKKSVNIIYLCSPNNPTGSVLTRSHLEAWITYAKTHNAVILFDSAYERFIQDPSLPRSIYEIPGAREVAVEFRSFSKTAGFTGLRCAYTVVPKEVVAMAPDGTRHPLHSLWFRRQSTKFNGVAYIVQRAAEAVYSPEGREQVNDTVKYYMENARIMVEKLTSLGYWCCGGTNAPYVWTKAPSDSWSFFQRVLSECHVVCTPGVGFGSCGEGYVRFSAFNQRENVIEAMKRIEKLN
jgi:LL-diaminopimelate aminotransferase